MTKTRILLLIAFAVFFNSCSIFSFVRNEHNNLSPLAFGLREAKSGEERFWVLYNTHREAVYFGKTVDYQGIDTLEITIPENAKSIPLTNTNDFKDVVFNVTNYATDFFLFTYVNEYQNISIGKDDIDCGDFRKNPYLFKGRYLLSIKDVKPWVEKRDGYSYGHIREDILLVENGMAVNKTVMPYNNDYSEPVCKLYTIKGGVSVKNLSLNRTKESRFKTFLLMIEGVNNLSLDNILVFTPENSGQDDQIISLKNCANINFNNISINGTYSRKDYSGYGVTMCNIWNFNAQNFYGHGNWGVFGNNNINNAHLSNSDINRFDIHCYGKDVSFDNVVFKNNYNQFSSVYGTILFNNCTFVNFIPVINGSSYNAYVGYNIVFNNCNYSTDHDTPVLISGGYADNDINKRYELKNRSLPNVTINNMTLSIPERTPNVYLFFFNTKGGEIRTMDYISSITVNGLFFRYDNKNGAAKFVTSNVDIKLKKAIKERYTNIDLLGNKTKGSRNSGQVIRMLNYSK